MRDALFPGLCAQLISNCASKLFTARGTFVCTALSECGTAGSLFYCRRFGDHSHASGRRRTVANGWERHRFVSNPLPRVNVVIMLYSFIHSLLHRADYQQFVTQPSENMDDTGYFSIQVISQALLLWNLELIPFESSDSFAKACRIDPTQAQAYIFNMKDHWFCVRRFIVDTERQVNDNRPYGILGGSPSSSSSQPQESTQRIAWFNLNSVLNKPEYMSSLYIAEYLEQMKKENYSIFVIKGDLPACPADKQTPHYRLLTEAELAARRIPLIDLTKSSSQQSNDEEEMQRAIRMSLETAGLNPNTFNSGRSNIRTLTSDTDAEMEAAMRLSMECFKDPEVAVVTPAQMSESELRDKRLSYYDKIKWYRRHARSHLLIVVNTSRTKTNERLISVYEERLFTVCWWESSVLIWENHVCLQLINCFDSSHCFYPILCVSNKSTLSRLSFKIIGRIHCRSFLWLLFLFCYINWIPNVFGFMYIIYN